MTKQTFIFPKVEVRTTTDSKGRPRYIVKGYAVAKNVPHTYQYELDTEGNVQRTFKSLFTTHFEESMLDQLKTKPIFVDALHTTASNMNIRSILDNLKTTNPDLEDSVNAIESNLKVTQFPLAKVTNFQIDEHGLFVETELNPSFREVDEDHKRYFDAIWKSMQEGYINTMSINFAGTNIVERDGLEVIDDGEVYGISYQAGGALGSAAGITEVAMRTITETRKPQEVIQKMEEQPKENIEEIKLQMQKIQEELQQFKDAQAQAARQAQQQAIEKEKETYQQEIENLKAQLEERQKQTSTPQGSKGTVADQPTPAQQLTEEQKKALVDQLNWNELATLQLEHPELIGTELARQMGLLRRSKSDLSFGK